MNASKLLFLLPFVGAACSASALPAAESNSSPDSPSRDFHEDAPSGNEPSGNAPSGNAPSDDAPSGDAPIAVAGTCLGTLAEVGVGCPSTYLGGLAKGRANECGFFAMTYTGACGANRAVAYDFETHAAICVYDAAGTSLVGAAVETDTNEYCGGAAYILEAGQIASECANISYYLALIGSPVGASAPCSDASSDAQADGGTGD